MKQKQLYLTLLYMFIRRARVPVLLLDQESGQVTSARRRQQATRPNWDPIEKLIWTWTCVEYTEIGVKVPEPLTTDHWLHIEWKAMTLRSQRTCTIRRPYYTPQSFVKSHAECVAVNAWFLGRLESEEVLPMMYASPGSLEKHRARLILMACTLTFWTCLQLLL